MPTSERQNFQKALGFVEDTENVDSMDLLSAKFCEAIKGFGFDTFIVTGIPNLAGRFSKLIVAKHWPTDWSETYINNNYIDIDPVAKLCRETRRAFLWSKAPYDRTREARAHIVMQSASDFGMRDGLCIPVHNIHGIAACISLGGRDFTADAHALSAVQLISLYVFQRMVQISELDQQGARILSEREREVLSWTAIGKSAWEVGRMHPTRLTQLPMLFFTRRSVSSGERRRA